MDKKESLLKIGLDLFSTKSFEATGIREISRNAAIPTGSFHYYFKNKEEYAIAVLDYFFEINKCQIENALQADQALNAKEKVIKIFQTMISYHQGNSKRLNTCSSCVVGNIGQEVSNENEALSDKCHELFKKMIFGVQALIELGQKDLSVKNKIESNFLAEFVFNAFEGALIQRKVNKSDQPLHDYIYTLKKVL